MFIDCWEEWDQQIICQKINENSVKYLRFNIVPYGTIDKDI